MKTGIIITLLISMVSSLNAALYQIELSPSVPGLNEGSNPYTIDHAVGLSGANEATPNASNAFGDANEIIYDDDSGELFFDFEYGSDFFGTGTDLTSDWTATHIHGPGGVNAPSPNMGGDVIFNLAGDHTPGSSALTGSFFGSVTLDATNEGLLFDNALYINIHSTNFTSGEIRGQLIPTEVIPEPNTYGFIMGLITFGILIIRKRN